MKELIIYKQGEITNQPALDRFLKELPDGPTLLKATDRRKRSIEQNAYLHGVVLPLVRDGLINAGYDINSNEEAKKVVKSLFCKKILSDGVTEITVHQDTSELTKDEFSAFIDNIQRWASEFLGVYVPSSEEQMSFL